MRVIRLFLFMVAIFLFLTGCASAGASVEEPMPGQGLVIFEVKNDNITGGYAKVFIKEDCRYPNKRLVGELLAGEKKRFLMRLTEFPTSGFYVYVRLYGASGTNVTPEACTRDHARVPLNGGIIWLRIPADLRHMVAPGTRPF